MRLIPLIIFVIFIQLNQILCEPEFGSIFPIPLSTFNDDPTFQECPKESGAYTHTTNCSLFHMCTFGIHTIYSCIDGFFFNPTTGKCQYLPVENEIKCTEIVQHMLNTELLPDAESVKNYDYYHRRKSSATKCTRAGVYPDVLDCSIFHYCHQNQQHEILKCPNGLHFDPKLFMCSAPQLVNCQYEPPTEPTVPDDEIDKTPIIESDPICHNYAPGTHLPVANKFDEFIICEEDGRSVSIKCQPGFNYNALTTSCDQRIETTTEKVDTTTFNLLQLANRLNDDRKRLMTDNKVNPDVLEQPIPYVDPKIEDKISIIEKISTTNTPLSRMMYNFHNNYNQYDETDEVLKIIFISILILIGLVLLGSTIFGAVICIRAFSSPPVEVVGPWKILAEESKV